MQFDSGMIITTAIVLLVIGTLVVYKIRAARGKSAGPHGYAGATVEEKYREQLEALMEQLSAPSTKKASFLKRCRKRLKVILILYIKERYGLTATRPTDVEKIRTASRGACEEERAAAIKRVYEKVDAASSAPSTAEQMRDLCRQAAAALGGDGSGYRQIQKEKTVAAG
ncbi:MAG: hypothetical protein GF344_06235 [Chitinivibrionales bacterium]|nr:hypothetical protein [Chitinivibrionales bacterium]MBD3356531.1 hypothetical protein [Chitinivibrionales bacterium]